MKKRILAGLLSLVMVLSMLPTAALAADDGSELGITSAVVADFAQNGSGTPKDVDITKGDADLNWHHSREYTIRVTISTDSSATNRCLTVTLPAGMKYTHLADEGNESVIRDMTGPDNTVGPDGSTSISVGILSSGQTGSGTYPHNFSNTGTLEIHIKDDAGEQFQVDFVVGIDRELYDYSGAMKIEDAIQLSYTDSKVTESTVSQGVPYAEKRT